MLRANRSKTSFRKGSHVTVPAYWILPYASSPEEIVINLSELRAYLIRSDDSGQDVVETYPIAIGKEKTKTPEGNYTIVEKRKDPVWHIPASIRKEDPSLPEFVPAGPENPLGKYALWLTWSGLMMHGTNVPSSIGKFASHGCLRMYPEDIEDLFNIASRGLSVRIVREPVKVAKDNGRIFIEVHQDPQAVVDLPREAVRLLNDRKLLPLVDLKKVAKAIVRPSGIPEDVTSDLETTEQ